MLKNKYISLLVLIISLFGCTSVSGTAYCQTVSKVVGELFGKPVTEEEFNYFYKTALIFTRSTKKDADRTI